MRSLVVEDDFTARLVLQRFLSRYGECHIAVNGKEAVDAFRLATENGSSYNLVCMDILLPEMDGKEAVKEIRSYEQTRGVLSSKGAKIIMTTAVDEVKNVIQSFQALCDAYLVKPVSLGELQGHLAAFHLI